MMVMPLDFIYAHPGDLLARMADIMGGPAAKIIVVVDAIIVLCGGVLAAYVGVSSLLKTLATDSILPNFLAATNRRNAAYTAIITFCLFSILLFILVFSPHNPTNIGSFGGVFAIAFLCVLLSFIYADILLKLYRQNLGRLVIAEWWEVFFCSACLLAALLGHLLPHPCSPTPPLILILYLSLTHTMIRKFDSCTGCLLSLHHLSERMLDCCDFHVHESASLQLFHLGGKIFLSLSLSPALLTDLP
jgi:amino acid transporter